MRFAASSVAACLAVTAAIIAPAHYSNAAAIGSTSLSYRSTFGRLAGRGVFGLSNSAPLPIPRGGAVEQIDEEGFEESKPLYLPGLLEAAVSKSVSVNHSMEDISGVLAQTSFSGTST